jgi:hypothetical protein
MAEYYIQGLTRGFVTAAEVIRWSDEVIVASPKPEDWMLDISTAGEDDRMGVLHHLHAVTGEIDQTALTSLLAGRQTDRAGPAEKSCNTYCPPDFGASAGIAASALSNACTLTGLVRWATNPAA